MKLEVNEQVITDAKNFIRSIDAGVLSTVMKIDEDTYPFGAMCPFVLSLEGEVIVLISDIAMHTKNIKESNKVSFSVFTNHAKNKQASSRICIVGDAHKVEKESDKYSLVSKRYLRFFPEAKSYFEAHNFNFYTITPVKAHYVQTFGKIYTFDGALLSEGLPEWAGEENSVIEHMNNDHQNVFSKYLSDAKIDYSGDEEKLKLVDFDQHGFHLSSGRGDFNYLNFPNQALTLADLRKEFVDLARR
ncbi:conserved hypothetical protein [Halobacteriovorax marinus SJ]|uniref:Uncharacterized protein n=1 Tax=Halobacteriovorax marinus (strain ATCC BAA-682 / DSM 15412 / SJ) TaxID=862908 RepID=E1WX17_HALMS|nr:DUF2470 domain-containing protein [Halobacteriovorax marinus]CBW25718.1 conserved hypothetical protein [Halobacteriovorax marinus SJ]